MFDGADQVCKEILDVVFSLLWIKYYDAWREFNMFQEHIFQSSSIISRLDMKSHVFCTPVI